jgi:hypothetical protein
VLSCTGLSSANTKPRIVTVLRTRVSRGDGKHKIRMFILLCFATKFQHSNSFYTQVQAVHSVVNILSAVKEHDAASTW